MVKKTTIAVITPIALAIISIFAVGEGTSWTFTIDQSTNIDQSVTTGDIITNTIINIAMDSLGVDLEGLRELCDEGGLSDEFTRACELLD